MGTDAVEYDMAQLAEHLGGRLRGDGDVTVRGVNTLVDATADQVSFIINQRYAVLWPASNAGAAIVTESLDVEAIDDGRPLIVVPDAELASLEVLKLFKPAEPVPDVGVHPTAWAHSDATIHGSARVGPHVSVDRDAVIEAGVVLHAGVRIYAEARIGEGTVIHANSVVRERCRIGRDVILHSNVSIGADGFGYRPAADGSRLLKMPHLGIVVIEDEVEIGAASCVDRAKFGSTVVGRGTKIDNQVQVAHNVKIGRQCVIASTTGIGGSTTIGDGVQIGGCVGIADHLKIGDEAKIGAGSAVIQDVPAGEYHVGYPAHLADKTLREWVAIRKLPELVRQRSRPPEGR